MTFSDGAVTLGVAAVGADGRASLVVPSASAPPLSIGTHSISGAYTGDAQYQSSAAGPLNITVGKAASTLALASTPAQLGQPLTLKAAVSVVSPAGTLGGTLVFTNGANIIAGCAAVALQNGVGTCITSLPQLGDYNIAVSYSGDANTAPSTANLRITVMKAVAAIYTAATATAPVFGSVVKVNALLLGAPGVAAPTGTVTFSDGPSVWAPVPIDGDGRASFALPWGTPGAFGAGPHSLMAVYSGDANYASASAPALSISIGKASTSTVLNASVGAPVSATILVLPPGSGTPTGIVQFFQGSTQIGAVPLEQTGSIYTATLPAGVQNGSIWAIYQGDANFSGSSSQTVTLTARAQVSITTTQNPALAGQPLTFTVQVSGSSGASAPGGSVQLSNDGAIAGSAPLIAGQATFTLALAPGSHTIVANYSGDSVYAAGNASLVQVVSRPVTSLSLSSSQSTSVYGQSRSRRKWPRRLALPIQLRFSSPMALRLLVRRRPRAGWQFSLWRAAFNHGRMGGEG